MTKFLTFIALLGGGVFSIAQTTLKPSVFIDTKSDDFKKGIVEIKEYTNYEVYQQLQRNLKSGNSAAINADMIRQAFITRKIALQKGTYIIDNNEQHFEFEIGNSGQLVGEGKFVNKKRNIPSTYIFNNGKLAEIHIFTPEGRLRKKNIFKGNTIEGLVYDHAGNIAQKIEIYTNLKEGADQIVTNYHKNGNPSKEVNTIKNTTKYDPEGKITEKWYVTEKGNCKELYEKGVISQKICEDRSIKESTVSTYKNGKLLETKKL